MNTMHFYVVYNWRQCQYTRGAVTIGQGKNMKWFDCFIEISLRLMTWCCCWCWCCFLCLCKHWKKRESKNRKKIKNEWVDEQKTNRKKSNTLNKRQQKETRLIHTFFMEMVLLCSLVKQLWTILSGLFSSEHLHRANCARAPRNYYQCVLPCNQSASRFLALSAGVCVCFYHHPIYIEKREWMENSLSVCEFNWITEQTFWHLNKLNNEFSV